MIFTVTLNPSVDHTLYVPNIEFNQVIRSDQIFRDCGGKGFNVSRALKQLGLESIALGFIGGDTGRWEEQNLHLSGIETNFDNIMGETRTCVVILEPRSSRYVKVNEPGPEITTSELERFSQHLANLARPGNHFVFSGSLPPGVPVDYYKSLILLVQSQGALAYLDTSGEPLNIAIQARPYLVKPNRQEAEGIVNHSLSSETDYFEAIQCFLDKGVNIISLSLGADGLLLAQKSSHYRAVPPRINANNPVGTGDALLAGILYGLQAGWDTREIARWGVACGTATALMQGVNFGSLEDVKKMNEQVRII